MLLLQTSKQRRYIFTFFHIIQTIMLQERFPSESIEEHSNLNHELKEYKKINYSLRRKLKEKDAKIHQLFGYIQDTSKALPHSPEHPLPKNQLPHDRHPKLTLSDNRKREKQNKNVDPFQESSIFRQPSISWMGRNREEVRLPALEKKSKNIFSVQQYPQNPQKKSRVVRIPMERLKPIDSEEIRKRFLMKYPRFDNGNELC